jgi:hypothetical protein
MGSEYKTLQNNHVNGAIEQIESQTRSHVSSPKCPARIQTTNPNNGFFVHETRVKKHALQNRKQANMKAHQSIF